MSSSRSPADLRRRVAEAAGHRCGYCRSSEAIVGIAMEVDHLIPKALGGPTEESSLWLACSACNAHKGQRIAGRDPESGELARLFDPREQAWHEHFAWTDSGSRILGRTAIGRATVAALQLNRPKLVRARRAWVVAGWHPPAED